MSSKFERLTEDGQREVKEIFQKIFYRWPAPVIPVEARADWTDDLAVLFVDFSASTLVEAIAWHRQNSEKRPSIAAIREQCRIIRGNRSKAYTASEIEYNRYDREVNQHISDPNNRNFVPFALLMRDHAEYRRLLAECRVKNYAPGDGELQAWWDDRNRRTDEEWRQLRLQGVKHLVLRGGARQDGIRHVKRGGDMMPAAQIPLGVA